MGTYFKTDNPRDQWAAEELNSIYGIIHIICKNEHKTPQELGETHILYLGHKQMAAIRSIDYMCTTWDPQYQKFMGIPVIPVMKEEYIRLI